SLADAREASVETLVSRNCATSICRIASARSSSDGSFGSSPANPVTRSHLLGVDLRERRTLLVPGPLPLGCILHRHGANRGGADLVGDRRDPFEELLDPCARGDRLPPLEVDQLARESVSDRPPEVLLEQAPRDLPLRFAVVDRARTPGCERVAER